MQLDKNTVAVGLSGGVDSTVVAHILKQKGYNVIGITMILFNEYNEQGDEVQSKFIQDAQRVANKLNIKHYVVDYTDVFKNTVIEKFKNEYLKGKTPNPCVNCNKAIKYGKLLKEAHKLGAYYIATGHYARVEYDAKIHKYRIYRGKAKGKDQGYVLYSLNQEKLKHILFPLGEFKSKSEIRKIASKIDPEISQKSDSMGICFVQNGDYVSFLSSQDSKAVQKGNFINTNGKILGKHKGIVRYTIGQRRGLGQMFNKRMFVVDKDAQKNEVVLGEDKDTYATGLIAKDPNFVWIDNKNIKLRVQAKICQWGWFLPATVINLKNGRLKVIFDKKERAVAPGQAVVFYIDNEIIGGATIELAIKK